MDLIRRTQQAQVDAIASELNDATQLGRREQYLGQLAKLMKLKPAQRKKHPFIKAVIEFAKEQIEGMNNPNPGSGERHTKRAEKITTSESRTGKSANRELYDSDKIFKKTDPRSKPGFKKGNPRNGGIFKKPMDPWFH